VERQQLEQGKTVKYIIVLLSVAIHSLNFNIIPSNFPFFPGKTIELKFQKKRGQPKG
jgi:hypothetical protein